MGSEYAWVHLKYTIPPAVILSILYRPLYTRLDAYRVLFLIFIAVTATTPWDSYLIRQKIWTYPPRVIHGATLFGIPAEEYFFFVIQTYLTSLIYLFCNKPVLHSAYLVGRRNASEPSPFRRSRMTGQVALVLAIAYGGHLVLQGREGTYLGLIVVWAFPFALLLWSLAYQFLVGLEYTSTLLPIALPTIYLWIVDTIALKRGTWRIESGTKLGLQLWEGLEIEEALFFLTTNVLIVFGLVAFDNAIAVLVTFPSILPQVPAWPSPVLLVKALCMSTDRYDCPRLDGIREAVSRLQRKSRSFHLASSTFTGRLRVDLVMLYSFCRVADDLVDDAKTDQEAMAWITKLREFLNMSQNETCSDKRHVDDHVNINFPATCRSALLKLPLSRLSYEPLFKLLQGFITDLRFNQVESTSAFPIVDEAALLLYGSQVAGTIAELVLDLVSHHVPLSVNGRDVAYFKTCGREMGIALQTVNIARDIGADADMGRVYLPTDWLKEEGLTPRDVLEHPDHPHVQKLRGRLLRKAFNLYEENIGAIAELPVEVSGPMRTAIESYMEIGRVLSDERYRVKNGRATVPRLRRVAVAWKALNR